MYRIKFPSGEEATIESLEGLKDAVAAGTVTSYCYVMHQRTGQWLPIVRHPHYHQALTGRSAGPVKAPAMPEILVDPLAKTAGAPEVRTTAAALDVPALDDLLEMTEPAVAQSDPVDAAPTTESPPARTEPSQPGPRSVPHSAAAQPAPAPVNPRPRGRSRDLEFLYVPESRATRPSAPVQAAGPAVPARAVPRTAGPPPRPNSEPKGAGVPAPAPGTPEPPAPSVAAKAASVVEPAPAGTTAPARQTAAPDAAPTGDNRSPAPEASPPEAAVPAPEAAPARVPAPQALPTPAAAPVRAPAPVLAPTVMLETEVPAADDRVPPKPAAAAARRATERFDHDLMDPVEAALNFETPAPIELDRPRSVIPAGRARLMLIAAGVVAVLGAGVVAWSPWSGGPAEVAAATPSRDVAERENGAAEQEPAMPELDLSGPAEVDPALDSPVYAVSPDAPFSSHTSFGGTAAPSDEPLPPAAVNASRLPGAPRTSSVAVPVLGAGDPTDSLRLARLKQAIAQPGGD